jgi:hypothetical protein
MQQTGLTMSFASRATSLQSYNMLLYRQAIHPEFFPISGRQRLEHGEYEFEAWIFKGGHSLRFQFDGGVAIEVVTDQIERLPNRGLVAALPCAGEKDHDQEFGDHIAYMTSIQTETMSDHLYLGTYNELVEHARMTDGLLTVWTDEIGKHNLSLIDMQRYSNEVHVQSYHCRSDCSLVLRTQSIFQTKEE